MMPIIQLSLDAVTLASLYALVALGIALIFGVMRLINFAHGELIMLGGYTLWAMSSWPFPIMVAATLAVPFLSALAMDRLAFRPVRGAPGATLLITSFTISYLVQNLMILFQTSTAKAVSMPPIVSESIRIAGLRFPLLSLVTVVTGAIILVLLAAFLRTAPLGIQMRAAAEDFLMARLLGVRANVVIAAAFGISGLLAGFVALIVVAQTGVVTPSMGLAVTLVGFVATVIGGMGSIPGAALGGFVLGVTTVILQVVLPLGLAPYRDAFLFIAVIAILLLRPQGLLTFRTRGESI
jgi:branched-chain amino acid transport system permease protein